MDPGSSEEPLDSSHARTSALVRAGLGRRMEEVESLYLRFHATLLAAARRRLDTAPNRELEAEDLVSEAWARFCADVERGRLRQLDSPTARKVLHRLLRDVFADRARRERTRKRGEGQARPGSNDAVEFAPTFDHRTGRRCPAPSERLRRNEQLQRVAQALDTTERRTFSGHVVNELDYAALARAEGVTPSALRSRIARLMEKLRRALAVREP